MTGWFYYGGGSTDILNSKICSRKFVDNDSHEDDEYQQRSREKHEKKKLYRKYLKMRVGTVGKEGFARLRTVMFACLDLGRCSGMRFSYTPEYSVLLTNHPCISPSVITSSKYRSSTEAYSSSTG